MLDVFIPEPTPGPRQLPFLASPPSDNNWLFQNIPLSEYSGIVRKVNTPAEAYAFLLPHHYSELVQHPAYFDDCLKQAREAGKRVILFAYQDDAEVIRIPNSIIFRPSAYRSALKSNEVLMPAYVEDIGRSHPTGPLHKGERPTVGFVGKAAFAGLRERVRHTLHNALAVRGSRRSGMYFRRKALSAIAEDASVSLHAMMRRTYSGNRKTIELSPEKARSEYIQAITDNQFTLTPRGDGNYSLRFFETLSLGRIPVVIDSDMPLPLEREINYSAFCVQVPWKAVAETPKYIRAFFDQHSEETFVAAQREARGAFEEKLYMPAFLRRTLTKEYLDTIA